MQVTAKMTGAAFDTLTLEESERLELLEGECIQMSSTTPRHQGIVKRITGSLDAHLIRAQTGGVYPDIEFVFGENTRLRPDLAVILGNDWHNLDLDRIPVPIPPAIVVEVISPSERTSYSTQKVRIYLRQVQEVWQIFPEDRAVLVYTPSASLLVLGEDDELHSPLIPGWSMLLRQAFAK